MNPHHVSLPHLNVSSPLLLFILRPLLLFSSPTSDHAPSLLSHTNSHPSRPPSLSSKQNTSPPPLIDLLTLTILFLIIFHTLRLTGKLFPSSRRPSLLGYHETQLTILQAILDPPSLEDSSGSCSSRFHRSSRRDYSNSQRLSSTDRISAKISS